MADAVLLGRLSQPELPRFGGDDGPPLWWDARALLRPERPRGCRRR